MGRRYRAYLRSPEWQAKREAALESAGRRCQVCNGTDRLEVHHRTYENLGGERPGDLTVLCADCHELFHERIPRRERAPSTEFSVRLRHAWMRLHRLERRIGGTTLGGS